MNREIKNKLIEIAREKQTRNDPSHDFQHIFRVFNLALEIGKEEKADLDVLIPAALFHDVIVYRKDHPKSKNETNESAEVAENILKNLKGYPQSKIEKVMICIKECSFSKGVTPDLLESKILQDADRLEATGAISIMRTFSSGGQMNRGFYDPADPFCEKGTVASRSNLDLFYDRLLVVGERMHTKFAKRIAKRRTAFLNKFLNELKTELKESKVI
ncbi:MAG: HD domain-containing protein [Bacteroidetes bacterium]|nr:HD domain-containing protein [Bacteroidota bacterium]